ncbi:MAG: ATP-binding protein [Pseudomonadota bacterium]
MNAIQKELSLNVTPAQLNALLVAYLPRNLPVLITGAPGVGKSDIVAQATNQLGFDLVISHPVTEDPTDPKGLPFPAADGTSAHFLPFGNLDKILKATRSTVWFLDDLGQASPAVQAAYMQLLLARRVGEHVLPDCITFVAATNRRTDNAGVSGILDPVISRFATVVNVVPDIQSWSAWAVRNDMPYELLAFLRFRQDLLYVPKNGRDIANSPSPRTWGFLGKKMRFIPQGLELIEYVGSVGQGAATELQGFLDVFEEIASVEEILLNPQGVRLPDGNNPATLNAVVAMLAARVDDNNIDRMMVYVNRLIEAGFREFVGFFISDAIKRDPNLQHTPSFIRETSFGELGKVINGNVATE